MESLYLLMIVLFVAGLLTWRLLTGSRREQRHERRASASLAASGPRATSARALPRARYAAKTLRICNNPCRAALKLRDQSFLVAEAPDLPLPGCDRACFCSYSSHTDRRVRDDRRYPAADIVGSDELLLPDSAVEAQDSRSGDDRRQQAGKKKREPYAGIY